MDSIEKNKIFAAVLCAGIVAMLAGFIANKLVHPKDLEQDAVAIESMDGAAAGGVAVVKMPDPILDLIATADIAKGEKLSKACAACHSFDSGGVNKVGPNLHAMVGNPKGAKAGFSYSGAMSEFGGVWGYEDLNFFLWKPKNYMPGTKMNYAGLKKPNDRAAIIAWLRTQGSNGFALPNEAEIAAEAAKLAPPEAVAEDSVAKATQDGAAKNEDIVQGDDDAVIKDDSDTNGNKATDGEDSEADVPQNGTNIEKSDDDAALKATDAESDEPKEVALPDDTPAESNDDIGAEPADDAKENDDGDDAQLDAQAEEKTETLDELAADVIKEDQATQVPETSEAQ